jgi:archaemetzincin
VLPDDGLAIDPKEPPQSFRSWMTEKLRNPVTRRRKTIYVAPAPKIDKELSATVGRWAVPFVLQAPLKGGCNPPKAEQAGKYLEAFYHPLPVKILPAEVRFVPWSEGKTAKPSKQPQYIGLQVGKGVTRITTRPCPDEVYPQQLNLNDILDAAIEVLPDDAYALVMLTDHDLYEDDDDDFCCGRAYGSSRVAVVSSSRYHPLLDEATGIEREHMWPFSHCETYVQRMCRDAEAAGPNPKRRKTGPPRDAPATDAESPMTAVIQAGLAAPPPTDSPSGLWLSRMARTVAHEVGHCFCLAHCSYYACVMQGTAGIAEDMRQPPYLCLVCLAKLTRAIGDVEKEIGEVQLMIARYTALAKFCETWKRVAMFAAYGSWLGKRIESLKAALPSV